jgi:hypothetical protein
VARKIAVSMLRFVLGFLFVDLQFDTLNQCIISFLPLTKVSFPIKSLISSETEKNERINNTHSSPFEKNAVGCNN